MSELVARFKKVYPHMKSAGTDYRAFDQLLWQLTAHGTEAYEALAKELTEITHTPEFLELLTKIDPTKPQALGQFLKWFRTREPEVYEVMQQTEVRSGTARGDMEQSDYEALLEKNSQVGKKYFLERLPDYIQARTRQTRAQSACGTSAVQINKTLK